MKKFLLLIPIFVLSLFCAGAEPESLWLTNQTAAVAKAKKENKPILMLFTGSDWCPHCVTMERNVYSTPEFQKFARENLVLLMLDFPSRKEQTREIQRQNRALQGKFGVRGFPTAVLVAPDGRELDRIVGACSKDKYLAVLQKVVTDAKAKK